MQTKISAPAKKPPATADATGQKKTAVETTELIVWRLPKSNLRLIVAYRDGDDPSDPTKLVSVICRDNRNFLPKMKLKATPREGGNAFDLFGPLPRWRGRY